jgi:hypothetical protein
MVPKSAFEQGHRVDDAQHSRLGWRFTLRDLFLAVLTVAVLVGWGVNIYRDANRSRTAFFDSINWNDDVHNAVKDLGGSQMPHQEEKFWQFGNGDGYRFEEYRLALAETQHDQFMDALKLRVRDRIVAGNCIDDFATVGLKQNYDGQWFISGYHRGSSSGRVLVNLLRQTKDEVLLFILVYEGRKPRGEQGNQTF